MIIERNSYNRKIVKVGDLEVGDIFELAIGSITSCGTPFLKTDYESPANADEVTAFNLSANEEMGIDKTTSCFIAINVSMKYELQILD